MPSGYLKHQPGIGKRSRGSSSRNYQKMRDYYVSRTKASRSQKVRHLDRYAQTSADFSLESYSSYSSKIRNEYAIASKGTKQTTANVGYCCICCEEQVPLEKLFHNCKHDLACRTCLRTIHIKQAQADVTQYSAFMKCFHPSCHLRLSDVQIQRLVNNDSEFTRHQRLFILSKSYKILGSTTLHCQSCDHPCQFRSKSLISESPSNVGGKFHTFACRTCRKVSGFIIIHSTTNQLKMFNEETLKQERNRLAELKQKAFRLQIVMQRVFKKSEKQDLVNVIKVIDDIQNDKFGGNDGWAFCPHCKIMISKGDGCSNMRCVCGRNFQWERLG